MSKYVWNRSFSLPRGWTPPETINYPFQPFKGGINPALAQKWRSEPSELEYTHKDTILYALGVGAGTGKEPCELKYIYENHEDFMVSTLSTLVVLAITIFKTIPSFAIVPAFKALGFGNTPGMEINLANVLHGEQYIKIHKPFNPDGDKLTTTARIGDIMDKGKHMVFATELETKVPLRPGKKILIIS